MKQRIEYIDTLKFIAIFGVIAIHCFALGNGVEILHFEIVKLNQIFRFAVPLFLMITGILFLNKNINLTEYIKKRVVRVALPLIFFTGILFLTQLTSNILYYYWYSWMMIGVIFAVPIINKFIQHSDESEIKYYLVIFIIFSIFAQIAIIFNIKWALDITFFYGPVSYLILGYFLSNVKISSNKHIIILLILFLISTLIKIKTGIFVYTQDFHTYLDLSFFQIIQVSTLFLIIKYVYDNKKLVIYKIMNNHYMKKYILSISKSSYGMYFV